MKIRIYLQIEGKKKLWNFHEIIMEDVAFRRMLSNEKFQGFTITEPLRTNCLTAPSRTVNGVDIYQANILRFVLLPFDDETVAICKLL